MDYMMYWTCSDVSVQLLSTSPRIIVLRCHSTGHIQTGYSNKTCIKNEFDCFDCEVIIVNKFTFVLR